jgi:hypothetical protein
MRIVIGGLALAALLLTATGPAQAQELVVNGGFETGTFSGWTVTGNGPQLVDGMPHTGNFAAWLGAVGGDGFLSQVLPTTAGTTYHLQFWLDHTGGGTPNDFSVQLNGVTLAGSTFNNDTTNFPYRAFDFDFTATGATTLQFSAREDPAYWHLDDVSVMPAAPAPEPASLTLFALGVVPLAGYAWRRRQKKAAG